MPKGIYERHERSHGDFLKRDDQILALRLQNEESRNRMTKAARDKDRALAQAASNGVSADAAAAEVDEDAAIEDAAEAEAFGSKTIVIHPGSRNLRIGLATDALPKTVPMVIARRADRSEDEDNDGEPRPKRMKMDDGLEAEPEQWFGDDFAREYSSMAADFKIYRRNNKRRVLPNSRELVVNWNTRNPPEKISEHNDPMRIDWTEIPADAPEYMTGHDVLRIPEKSKPRYRLSWPLKYGWLNESEYETKNQLYRDFFLIIEEAIKKQLNIPRRKDWAQYSCVFVIPDLYEKVFVASILRELLVDFGFQRICFIQESLAATFGAGYSISCIVDVGAQKTSICCVDEGMCMENSRINLKFGGEDVTETFIKMMLYDHLNYSDMNLLRRHDYLLAEELKQKFCTLEDAHISVQLYEFHLRAPGQDTRKYQFKTYDEVMLAPMGFFRPTIFDHSQKFKGRRSIVDRSTDLYDGMPNDPMSLAQLQVLKYASENVPSAVSAPPASANPKAAASPAVLATPSKPSHLDRLNHLNDDMDGTPRSSPAGSPAPEDGATPQPGGGGGGGGGGGEGTTAAIPGSNGVIEGPQPDTENIVPIMPLDAAIIASIHEGARGDDKKMRDFFGGIMIIGGGSKTYNFSVYLEQRLRMLQPNFGKEILVGPPPRELDPQVLVWKGGSVFGKLRGTNDSWIGQLEFDRLGARILNYKCMWAW
ncbi:hypothetical protein MBLNU459_g6051t1 [Dothideomycetes sp. NU459]